jgi:hypothetical protein
VESDIEIMEGITTVKVIYVGFTAALLFGVFGLMNVSEASRETALDWRIKTAMGQYRSFAEISNANHGDYSKVGTETDFIALKMDILDQGGTKFFVATSTDGSEYCVHVKLREIPDFYCIDSVNFSSIQTYIDPGQMGYCNGITFECPTDVGSAPPLSAQELRESHINFAVYGLIVVSMVILLGDTWRRALRLRKNLFTSPSYRESNISVSVVVLLVVIFFAYISTSNLFQNQLITVSTFSLIILGFGSSLANFAQRSIYNKRAGVILLLMYIVIYYVAISLITAS